MPLLGQRREGFSRRQCSARSKRSGQRCRNYAVLGRSTCRMHGGTSRREKDHWNYRDGRFSKDQKEVLATFRTFQLPIQVVIAIYPDSLAVGLSARQFLRLLGVEVKAIEFQMVIQPMLYCITQPT
jgi:hypothetical protein